ncbi:F-box domain-containing protein [Entamoeba marina]
MFHIHLPSITVLPHLTSLQYITGPTFVHLRKPNISIINEINSFLPNAQIITEKMENGDVLNKVHLFDTITTICSTKRSCVSLPIQFALSPNTDSIFPIEFKHLLLYDLHLPQRCSISIKDCETLSIQRCNKLTGIVGLGKCNLKSLSFSKDPSLSLSRLPTTLTFLDASDWKTLTLPNLHELVELRLKDCPSIKYLNLPTGLKILSVVECSLLRKFINLNELQLLSLKLAKCPLLKYASTPTTLTQLTLEHLDVFSYSFENQTQLINATLIGCGFLTKLNLPPSIRNITISCCSNLIEISNQQCNFDNASITSCSQLSALSISSINLSIEYLPSLQHITTENTKKITAIKSNVIPEINVEEYILKNVILDSIPIATNMYLNGCTIQQQQLSILTQVTSLKLKNMTNLTEITIGNSVKHLSIRKCGIESIVIPNSITHCSLQELHIKKLNIPTSCIELKLMKCPDIETIELPTTLSYLKIKKCKKDLLSNSFLPFIPNEILLDFCKSSN